MTVMPRGSQSARIESRSTGTPPWSTAITALVLSESLAAIVSAVRFPVVTSTSANTGWAPTYATALVVAMKENDGTTTSSPGPTPATSSARWSAVVQDETATAWSACMASAKADSNAATLGP